MTMEATRWIAAEALFEEWSIPFELVDQFEISDIKTADYSQVRQSEHRAPKDNVEQYSLQMSNGAKLPPIVLAKNDSSIIDGNTRVAAARRNSWETLPAYVISPADAKRARAVGAALNMINGQRLTQSELEASAKDFLDAGFPDGEIARRLGRTSEWARKFRKRSEFTERAGDHVAADKVKSTVAEKLADIPLDAPLAAVLDAVGKGVKIDRPTADKIVNAVKDTRSESDAMAAVNTVLDEVKPTQQGAAPKEPVSRAMASTMKKAAALIPLLGQFDVPLVDPLAESYCSTLHQLRAAIDDVLARLPVASDAA